MTEEITEQADEREEFDDGLTDEALDRHPDEESRRCAHCNSLMCICRK